MIRDITLISKRGGGAIGRCSGVGVLMHGLYIGGVSERRLNVVEVILGHFLMRHRGHSHTKLLGQNYAIQKPRLFETPVVPARRLGTASA
jgi:hypothetical protein